MKQKHNSLDVATGIDLMRTDVDLGQYIKENNIPEVRIRKKRNSMLLLDLKEQLKKDTRFLSILCRKPAKVKNSLLNTTIPANTSLILPSGPSQEDLKSDKSSATPFKNDVLRTISTRLSLFVGKLPSPKSFFQSTPIRLNSRFRQSDSKTNHKLKKKRIFKSSDRYEAYQLSLSPKLRKRRLNSEMRSYGIFDNQEILNIANGAFV